MRHERILSFVLVAHKPNTFSFCCLSTLLRHHQGLVFFLFFSGQGCAGNYKSIEAWPGLYNLCGIFDQWCFCVRAASENGLGSVVWSKIGFFQQTQTIFYEELG